MTVKELIKKLEKLDPNAKVVTYGNSDGDSYSNVHCDPKMVKLKRYRNYSWRGEFYDCEDMNLYPEDESFTAFVIS